jgi:hypothetical protein
MYEGLVRRDGVQSTFRELVSHRSCFGLSFRSIVADRPARTFSQHITPSCHHFSLPVHFDRSAH